MAEPRGLHRKYDVVKSDGTPVEGDYFVLRPGRDPHAATALRAYANSIDGENPELARDLFVWLESLEGKVEQHRGDAVEQFPP